jgi:hypothetical protein
VGKDHDDVVDGVHDTSDIDVEDEDGAECNANEEEKEVSELCKALDTKLDDWARDVHTMLTHLHPVPRGRVLTALVAELQKYTNDLPSAANIDEVLPRVIGLMHKHIKYVRKKLNLKQVKKLSKLGGFNKSQQLVLHGRSNPTTSRLQLPTELSLTEPSLMRTPQSDDFWQTTFVGWSNYTPEQRTKKAVHKQKPRRVRTPGQKRRREEEVLTQKEPPKKLADAKQKERTGRHVSPSAAHHSEASWEGTSVNCASSGSRSPAAWLRCCRSKKRAACCGHAWSRYPTPMPSTSLLCNQIWPTSKYSRQRRIHSKHQ